MKISIKKSLFAIVLAFFLFFGSASAASLSSMQINAILALLQAFGVDSAVISNVQNILSGNASSAVSTSSPVISYLSEGQGFAGKTITIYGSNFQYNPAPSFNVQFFQNGKSVGSLTSKYASANQLQFVLDPALVAGISYAGAQTVQIKVGNLVNGSWVLSNSASFIVLPYTQTPVSVSSAATATISVIAPAKDEILVQRTPYSIKWITTNFGSNTINIDLVATTSTTTSPLAAEKILNIASNVSNTGSFLWTPDTTAPTSSYMLLLSSGTYSSLAQVFDFSDIFYTITPPFVPAQASFSMDISASPITYNTADLVLGKSVQFNSGVINPGGSATGQFKVRWLLDNVVVSSGTHNSVPANSTVTNGNSYYNWTTQLGTHTIQFEIDTESTVDDPSRGNNMASVSVYVATPDGSTVVTN